MDGEDQRVHIHRRDADAAVRRRGLPAGKAITVLTTAWRATWVPRAARHPSASCRSLGKYLRQVCRMEQSALTLSSVEFLILAVVMNLVLLGGVVGLFWIFRSDKEQIKELLKQDFLIRMLTIAMLIQAVGMLALAGKLSSEVSTFLSGLAGFILGGAQKKKGPPE